MRKTFIICGQHVGSGIKSRRCTNLDETLYDQVASQNYYNTKEDVIRAVLRPFEHGFWSIQSRQVLNEETADQLITPTLRTVGRRWPLGPTAPPPVAHHQRRHRPNTRLLPGHHAGQPRHRGPRQALASQFGFSETEFNNLKAQNRVLRAWFYLRLLDAFRNVPLAVSYYDTSKNSEGQVEPPPSF
jgi:hypothetical protein